MAHQKIDHDFRSQFAIKFGGDRPAVLALAERPDDLVVLPTKDPNGDFVQRTGALGLDKEILHQTVGDELINSVVNLQQSVNGIDRVIRQSAECLFASPFQNSHVLTGHGREDAFLGPEVVV